MMSKSLSTSERFAAAGKRGGKLGEFCQVLYQLLVPHADDFGRQAGDVFTVKMAVFPTSPRKQEEFQQALTVLHSVRLITWYEANGRKCIQVENFELHQPGLHKRTKSQFPEPPDDSGNFLENPSELNRTEENRTEGTARAPRESRPLNAKATSTEPTPHPIKELLTEYDQQYLARYGISAGKPPKSYPAIAKDLIDRHGFERAMAMVRSFFASSDPFIVKACHGLNVLVTCEKQMLADVAKRTVVRHPSAPSPDVEATRRKLAEMDARPVGQWRKAGA